MLDKYIEKNTDGGEKGQVMIISMMKKVRLKSLHFQMILQ